MACICDAWQRLSYGSDGNKLSVVKGMLCNDDDDNEAWLALDKRSSCDEPQRFPSADVFSRGWTTTCLVDSRPDNTNATRKREQTRTKNNGDSAAFKSETTQPVSFVLLLSASFGAINYSSSITVTVMGGQFATS